MTNEQYSGVTSRLATIETKIDIALTSQVKLNEDHEARLRGVERRQWAFLGGMSVVSFVAAAIAKVWK